MGHAYQCTNKHDRANVQSASNLHILAPPMLVVADEWPKIESKLFMCKCATMFLIQWRFMSVMWCIMYVLLQHWHNIKTHWTSTLQETLTSVELWIWFRHAINELHACQHHWKVVLHVSQYDQCFVFVMCLTWVLCSSLQWNTLHLQPTVAVCSDVGCLLPGHLTLLQAADHV